MTWWALSAYKSSLVFSEFFNQKQVVHNKEEDSSEEDEDLPPVYIEKQSASVPDEKEDAESIISIADEPSCSRYRFVIIH